ncbi:MAG: hypothetical protein AAF928_20685 [Myxococcota bacterium]
MNGFLLAAAVLSAATFLVHVVLGGRQCVPPLLGSDVAWVARMTHYYCWHLVSMTLFGMAAGYGYAAWVPEGRDVAWLVTSLAVGFTAWSVVLGLWKRPRPWHALPQWVLFLAIAATALPGLVAARPS